MRERLEWSDVKLLWAILVFLDTQNWHPVGYSSYGFRCRIGEFSWGQVIDRSFVCSRAYHNDITRATRGCRRQTSCCSRWGYRGNRVCMKLFLNWDRTVPQGVVQALRFPRRYATKRSNVLVLCKLCFSLPFSNGSVEWMFKLVKTDHRTRLHQDTLSDLLEIQLEGPSLGRFSPKQVVEAWWKDCKTVHRPNQLTATSLTTELCYSTV